MSQIRLLTHSDRFVEFGVVGRKLLCLRMAVHDVEHGACLSNQATRCEYLDLKRDEYIIENGINILHEEKLKEHGMLL